MSQMKRDTSHIRGQGQAETAAQSAAAESVDPMTSARRPDKSAGAKARKQTASSAGEAAAILGVVPIENFVAVQRAQMEALAKATNVFMEGLTAINREVVDFGDRRARAILEGSKTAPTNGDWGDIWHFQVDYAGHATQAYMEEATKLFDLGLRVSQESWMPLQQTMATAFEGIFRKTD